MNLDIRATTEQQRKSRQGLERSKRKLCRQFSIPAKCFGGEVSGMQQYTVGGVPVRIIRPGGSRAVHCFNFKKRS